MPKCTQAGILPPSICIYLHLEFKHDLFETMEETWSHGHNVIHKKKKQPLNDHTQADRISKHYYS